MEVRGENNQVDHDLLIRIETKLERVIQDVNDIKTNTVGRVETLELRKAEKTDVKKNADRINSLENWKNWLIGTTTVTSGVAIFLAIEFFKHIITK